MNVKTCDIIHVQQRCSCDSCDIVEGATTQSGVSRADVTSKALALVWWFRGCTTVFLLFWGESSYHHPWSVDPHWPTISLGDFPQKNTTESHGIQISTMKFDRSFSDFRRGLVPLPQKNCWGAFQLSHSQARWKWAKGIWEFMDDPSEWMVTMVINYV